MGQMTFRMLVRPASTLGVGTGKSAWVPCRGARQVTFYAKATNNVQITANTIETANGDGSTPPLVSDAGWGSGGAALSTAGGIISNDLSAIRGGLKFGCYPSNAASPGMMCDFVRMTYTTAGSVTGFEVWAEVMFDSEEAVGSCGAVNGIVAYGSSS